MSVQTTYTDMGKAYAGQVADMNPREVISKVAEGDILYGYPAIRGTAENQVKAPTATGGKFLGVIVYTLGGYSSTNDVDQVSSTEVANVIRAGYVWVKTEQTVVAGDPVFFVHTTTVGNFRKDANTNLADAITGATFETAANAGDLVLIRLV